MECITNKPKALLASGTALLFIGAIPSGFGAFNLDTYNATATNSSDSQNLGIGLCTLGGTFQVAGLLMIVGAFYVSRHLAKSDATENTALNKRSKTTFDNLGIAEQEKKERAQLKSPGLQPKLVIPEEDNNSISIDLN